MRRALFATILFLMTAPTWAGTVVIGDDSGGRMQPYYRKAVDAFNAGSNVRFDGWCQSSCTIYLAIIPNDRLCATEKTRFIFHAPYGNGAEDGKRWFMTYYPKWVTQWLVEQGGLGKQPKAMPSSYILMHMRKC